MSLTALSRSLFTTAIGNWVSRAYLAVVAALLVWSYADAVFVAQADSSFVGIYAIAATAPVSLALLMAGGLSEHTFPLIVVICALLNAWLIGLALRRINAAHQP
ncbi:SCO4225 family membrane protein [Streptomyces fumanus]|uniref:SCO4225 family membrane protein n=1 Tax=Streptomyces fumanus TaxID=67302 RepID=UPI0033DEEEA4